MKKGEQHTQHTVKTGRSKLLPYTEVTEKEQMQAYLARVPKKDRIKFIWNLVNYIVNRWPRK